MSENRNIETLRGILFDTLQALKDPAKPMEIERALAIKEVAQVIVNTAKVEIDQRKLTSQLGTGFIPEKPVDRSVPRFPGETYTEATQHGSKTVTTLPGGATVTRHKMAG